MIANELLEALIKARLSSRCYTVALAVLRKSYGYRKKYAFFKKGELGKMTGIHHSHLSKTVKHMINCNILTAERHGYAWKIYFNKNYELWKIATETAHNQMCAEMVAKSQNRHRNSTQSPPNQHTFKGSHHYIKEKRKFKEREPATPFGSSPGSPNPTPEQIEKLKSESATAEQVKKIRDENFPKKNFPQCGNCKKQAVDIHPGGKCPYCGKWV